MTPASTHDCQAMPDLIVSGDRAVHADPAYTGEPSAAYLRAKGVHNYLNENGITGAALTEEQQADNRRKSKTRARVGILLCSWRNRPAVSIIAVSARRGTNIKSA
ncbi:MAG: hypothetical protein H7X97_08745 [Opitutaceae bacterium]|nr:hypothetical protein [Verrucomicrobiales bacterium]